jgi:hypothetical protein
MHRFYERDTEWETFSPSASLKEDGAEAGGNGSRRALLGEIGLVLAGAMGLAAAIDFGLMLLHIRPFV